MKQKLISMSILAAVVAFSGAPAWAQSTGTQDKSVGGTQSQRERDSQTPLPQGSRSAGGVGGQGERGDKMSQPASGRTGGERWAAQDIKGAQEALKNKGHDPGPIDGIMGPQTRQAIKAFQSSNGLKETGTLDSETAKKLGVERGGSSTGPSEKGMGSSSERGTSQKESTGSGKSSSTEKEPSSPMGK